MRTNERMTELGLVGVTRGTTFLGRLNVRFASLWRALKNRAALNPLLDFDDQQLSDLGLTRSDVERALTQSGVLDDPYRLLSAARQRGRRAYLLSLER
ncbi:DUF1127 domain-containing protein [Rhizobiales bacterium RZME27]|jgi:uncharacterized protein YjiS (DUF1127 family)|uniref:DUF1127 domain-containing protein n=1 Tax=Endobacterium cereale TaxID=2663029 RepID=A0A6A8A8Z0_9HYPH|nr:DUF1127 domain-containing protein [Endobacterium cereale]MEB2846833.1 DUF1127 domain-containing protein [Endobacterium cereale]MQY47745.1 DUF1127 domain-containing protein [Endobacterium cereale]